MHEFIEKKVQFYFCPIETIAKKKMCIVRVQISLYPPHVRRWEYCGAWCRAFDSLSLSSIHVAHTVTLNPGCHATMYICDYMIFFPFLFSFTIFFLLRFMHACTQFGSYLMFIDGGSLFTLKIVISSKYRHHTIAWNDGAKPYTHRKC